MMKTALLSLAYFLAAAASFLLTRFDGGVAFIWGATALLQANLMQRPARSWAGPTIGCTLTGGLAIWLFGLGPTAAIPLAICTVAEAIIAATLVRRWIDPDDPFEDIASVGWFVLAAGLIAPACGALPGAFVADVVRGVAIGPNELHRFTSHALGSVILTPLLLLAQRADVRSWLRQTDWRARAEAAGWIGLLAVVTLGVFLQTRAPLLFLPMLPLQIATFRLGRVGAAASLALMTAIGASATFAGHGPIVLMHVDRGTSAHFFQLYIAVAVLTALPAAAELARRRQLMAALAESEARYRILADRGGDVVLNIAADGIIRYASPSIRQIGGITPEDVIGRPAVSLVWPDDGALVARNHRRALAHPDRTFIVTHRVPTPGGGDVRWFEMHLRATIDDGGNATGVVSSARDVTEHKRATDALVAAANSDPLTGLANRRVFDAALDQLTRDVASGGQGCLVMIDIDHFKRINDRHGHDIGDAVIRCVADTLTRGTREHDLVARLGGEEFALLLRGANIDRAHDISERLRRTVAEAATVTGAGERVAVTISLGIAAVVAGQPGDAVFREADAALYEAKRAGRNCLKLAA